MCLSLKVIPLCSNNFNSSIDSLRNNVLSGLDLSTPCVFAIGNTLTGLILQQSKTGQHDDLVYLKNGIPSVLNVKLI